MKKSLSVLVATAMVSSVFASVAFAADTTLTTQQKLDALIAAGIFDKDGTGNGSELEANMSREQLAKILAKLKELKEVSGTSYTDVAADRWSAGFIQAVSKATPPLMDGVADGVFNPSGDVTLEQLATVAVRALGLQPNNSGSVKGNVSEWAKGYVATAIANGLLGEKADFTKAAIRSELVEATYGAKEVLDAAKVPAKVSVKEAKATGVQKVQVTFDKEVDPAVAKLSLKKGSVDVATTAKFADDKKSAVLTLTDTKISQGTYSVTLSGVAADQIATATAQFNAENEKIEKIDFVSANDTLAKASNVIVKLKASNQYGENASASAGNYTVYAGTNNDVNPRLTKNSNGDLLLKLNTNVPGYTSNLSIIPVNIYHNETRVSVSKNFKLGTEPFVMKTELGDVKYSNGQTSLNGIGENATLDILNYDQYGNLMPHSTADEGNAAAPGNVRVIFNGFEPALSWEVKDFNGDDVTEVRISLNQNVDKAGEYSFNVYNQAGVASSKVAVKSAKVATKVELGEMNDVIAAGDTVARVPLIAYDAEGNQLSLDDLVSTQNSNRIKISSSTGTARLVTAGEHKGKIEITSLPSNPNSVISLTAYIAEPNASSTSQKIYNVSDVRIPETIKVMTEPAKKIVAGAESAFRFEVYDQYGKKLDNFRDLDGSGNYVANGSVKYRVAVSTSVTGAVYATPNSKAADGSGGFKSDYMGSDVGNFDEEHKFNFDAAQGNSGSAKIEVVVQKTTNGSWANPVDVTNKVIREIQSISATDELTYSVNAVSDLYNAKDVNNVSVTNAVYDNGQTLSVNEQQDPLLSKFKREVVVSAKDSAGNTVAIPKRILSVTSSNPQVAVANVTNPSTVNGVQKSQGYVIGNKKGTATLNVSFGTHKGETLVKSVTVNTKDDIITSTKVDVGNKALTYRANDSVSGTETVLPAALNAFSVMNVKVTDNYGITYETSDTKKYNYLFGVAFSVKNPVGGEVSIDKYGNITLTGNVTSFEVTATSATGFSASTSFVIKR